MSTVLTDLDLELRSLYSIIIVNTLCNKPDDSGYYSIDASLAFNCNNWNQDSLEKAFNKANNLSKTNVKLEDGANTGYFGSIMFIKNDDGSVTFRYWFSESLRDELLRRNRDKYSEYIHQAFQGNCK